MFKYPNFLILQNKLFLITIPRIVVTAFVILQALGMLVYSGGSLHNKTAVGYSFTRNFFSDLGLNRAYNGDLNFLSMALFTISLIFVGLAFMFYYSAILQFFKKDLINYRLSIVGSIFAIGGSIALIGTGVTPADLVLDIHIFFANSIFKCFMVTSFCYTIVIYRSNILEKKYALGYGIFFLLITLYVGVLEFAPPARLSETSLMFQVVTQKLIVLTFCLSIVYQTFGFSKSSIFD